MNSRERDFENVLRPLAFEDFSGQDKVVDNLRIFVKAARLRGEALDAYLFDKLGPYLKVPVDAIVLGCTHFNYFKDTMREIMPENMHFVDGNEGTVRELMRQLDARHGLENLLQTVDYYYSGRRVEDAAELARIARYMERLDLVYEIQ